MSSSKVKCTCGWSWNKSDSSKKDMYICHECGRDNSNNMKNGGWLDNYNDSEVSLPEGYVGEGYDISGRDYSPAWGGQFEDGGLIPMAQNGRATRADSLAVLNSQLALNKFYDKEVKRGKLKKEKSEFPIKMSKEELSELNKNNLKFYREKIKERENQPYGGTWDVEYKKHFNLTPAQVKKLEYEGLGKTKSSNNNKAYYRDNVTPMQNLAAPFALIDSRIGAQGVVHYSPDYDYPGGMVNVYNYDPLAVTPFDMLTDAQKKLRVQKYGTDGVPKSYLSKTSTKKEIDKPIKSKPKPVEVKPQLQPRVKGLNLQPIEQTPINFPIQQIDTTPRFVEPKSFNISSQRTNMQGNNDYNDYTQEGATYEEVMRAQEAAKAYNAEIERKYGNEEALKNPKAVERLKQLRQNVEVTPIYQFGGNLYKAQVGDDIPMAQNGTNKPLYVESKNDPRYKAYQDSLTAYNYGEKEYAKFLKDRNEHNRYIKEKITTQRPSVDKKDVERLKQTPFPIYENSLAQDRRWAAGRENLTAAQQNKGKLLRITNNKPISVNSIKYTDIKQNDPGVLDILGRIVGVETKADKERSDNGAMYLGNSSYSRYKKPQQPVIVKPTTTKPSTKSKPITKPQQKEVNVKPQLQPRVEALNLRPIEQTPINIPIQELDFNTPIKAPKSYNVNMQRYNMKGPSDYYQANEEGVDYERAMQIKAASDAYNRDIEKRYGPQNEYRTEKSRQEAARRLEKLRQDVKVRPNYQMGGEVYPVNYVPEAQMGGSIPGSVGFTYARTNSPAPSNGKYAKKTMASAQNGEVIKDDMGYWNPDNWGEVVEIDSNDITMQGVDQPLLGISDTGDTKLMQPGKDYKFKGKKVTEYPLAKDGKELVKLNQLTNFTNYNTKQPGGWLDNY